MDVRNICITGKTQIRQFYSGCYTPLTHAAIDRTLTTILVSFPNETSSVLPLKLLERATSTGWTASVLSHIDTGNQI